ncbi:hypothetical protein SRHO_G00082410 [Serrasalmus rhombeus]
MMRNHLCCSAPVFLMLLGPWGALAGLPCQWGEECACLRCPAGQEPSMACGEVEGPDVVVECHICPPGTFSDINGPEQCHPHTACKSLNRWTVAPPTSRSDSVCGACLPGFHPLAPREGSALPACVTTSSLKRLKRNAGKSTPHGSGVGVANATNVRSPEEKSTEYAVFALVPIFCVMGLLGILICNLLKKKGYQCTAEKESGDEEAAAAPQKEEHHGALLFSTKQRIDFFHDQRLSSTSTNHCSPMLADAVQQSLSVCDGEELEEDGEIACRAKGKGEEEEGKGRF